MSRQARNTDHANDAQDFDQDPVDLRRRELSDEQKAALLELIEQMATDGFYVELETDSGKRYYLAFGEPEHIRCFLDAARSAPECGAAGALH